MVFLVMFSGLILAVILFFMETITVNFGCNIPIFEWYDVQKKEKKDTDESKEPQDPPTSGGQKRISIEAGLSEVQDLYESNKIENLRICSRLCNHRNQCTFILKQLENKVDLLFYFKILYATLNLFCEIYNTILATQKQST